MDEKQVSPMRAAFDAWASKNYNPGIVEKKHKTGGFADARVAHAWSAWAAAWSASRKVERERCANLCQSLYPDANPNDCADAIRKA